MKRFAPEACTMDHAMPRSGPSPHKSMLTCRDGVCALSAHAVERALHRTGAPLHDVGVDHGMGNTVQERLHLIDRDVAEYVLK
ncbi:MAG: hypothetical protein ABSA71_12240 [Desulfomonilia bacterium]|jgi:hypothetical protein